MKLKDQYNQVSHQSNEYQILQLFLSTYQSEQQIRFNQNKLFKKNTQLSTSMQYYQFVLSYYLKQHQKAEIRSKNVAQSLQLTFYIQLVSLLLVTKSDQITQSTEEFYIDLRLTFNYLTYIGRPYQVFTENPIFRLYSFIIPTIFLFFISIGFMRKNIQKYFFKQNDQHKKDKHVSNLSKLISIIYQIYIYLFALYSFDCYLMSITESTGAEPYNDISILAICIFLTINLLMFVFINFLSSESIHFQSSPLQVTQLKKNQFINFFLIVICLYFKNTKFQWHHIPVQIINIIILSYYIYEETKKKSSFFNLISLIILIFSFLYNFTQLSFIGAENKYQTGIIFILCPFFINLLLIGQEQFNKIIVNKTRKIEDVYQNLRILAEEKKKPRNKHQLEYIILTQKLNDQQKHDLFLSELSLFNKKIIKSQKSQKVFWYQKYIQIKYDLENYTETISLIHHFQQKQFYSELTKQFFRVSISLSYFQQIQLDMIKNDVYQLLYLNITKNGDNTQSLITKQYIQYKISAENSQQTLRNILIRKSEIYESALSGKATHENELFNKAMSLTKQAMQLQKKLKLEMILHKTFKIVQLMTILLIDFFNNVIQAELLRESNFSNEDHKENLLEEMSFLGLELQDDMIQMKILHYSQDFFTNLGYNKISNQITSFEFNSLLADAFSEIHQNLVTTFLRTGTCKKVGQDCELYIRGNQNNYYLITLQLQIQPLLSSKISIFAFAKTLDNQPRSIFVNQNGRIVGQTINFIALANSKNINIDLKTIYLLDVNKLLQNYKKIPLQKTTKIKFFNYDEEFLGIKLERNNLIEIQLLNAPEGQNLSEEDQVGGNQSIQFEPNQESFVVIPNSQCFDEMQVPLSEEKRDKTDQGLLKDETKKVFITMIKSKGESDSQSMAANAHNRSKNSLNIDKKDIMQADDQASSKFSRGFLDTSIYYSKYNRLEQFLEKKQLLFIYLSLVLFLMVLVINIIFYIISIVELVPNIEQVQNNQDLLTIKSNFLTPVHDCIISQVAYVSYFMLYINKQISIQIAYEKSEFSKDSIGKAFDLLKESYIKQLNNIYLQEFFYDESIEMYQFNQGHLEKANLPLKTSLINYLKSQYFVINENKNLDLTSLSNLLASNDYAFFMSNILIVDNHFDKLSQQVVDFILNNSIQNNTDGMKLFLKLTFLQSLMILLAFSYVFKIYSISQKYFHLFTDFNQYAVQIELSKINQLILLLSKDSAYKLYNYDIGIQEKKIQSNQINFSLKVNQTRIQSQKYLSPRIKILLTQIILILFFILPQIIIQQIDQSFYEKYQNTGLWIEKLSQTSSSLSAIYSYREINYQISSKSSYYDFFSETERQAQNDKVLGELVKIDEFINNFPFLDFSLLIMDENTTTLLENIQSKDICNFISHFNFTLAQMHCTNVYNGVAKLGIYNTISTIYRQISLEYENTNGFQIDLRTIILPFDELEISLIVSDAILSISDSLMNAVSKASDNIITIHNILTGMYFSIDIIFFFALILFYFPFLVRQQELVKNMIHLVPQYQFYLDQKFDTNFRLLMIQIK